jgi:hypothetical protein
MKASTFEKLIRKIVREEIDYALHREIRSLKEDLQSSNKQTLIEQPENIPVSEEFKSSLREKIMGTPNKQRKKPIQRINYTSNNTLNDLLNETAQGDTNTSGNVSPVSISEDFSTIGGIPTEAASPAVQEAVTRDYSDLMKAILKKKK